MNIEGCGSFLIDWTERTISVVSLAWPASDLDLNHLLQDHIVPRMLAAQGELVLHAGCVEFDGVLAVFLGETGAGKSTLSASLHSAGRSLLGDDAVVISLSDQGPTGSAVYRSLRLLPESINAVLAGSEQSAPMADYSRKRQIILPQPSHCRAGPFPIGAIFYLFGPDWDGPPALHPLSPTKACIKLIEQSFSLDPHDPLCASARLRKASELVLRVPSYELAYRHDYGDLGKVHTMIEQCISASRSFATVGASQ